MESRSSFVTWAWAYYSQTNSHLGFCIYYNNIEFSYDWKINDNSVNTLFWYPLHRLNNCR